MHYRDYVQTLFNHSEKAYAEFSQKLANSDYTVIGVRVPILRKLVKAHCHDENLLLADFELGKYLEVDFSYFAIGLSRCKTVAEQLAFAKQNMHFAKSWAITDMITSYFKPVSFDEFWTYFVATCADEHVFTRRFAYVFALKFYRDPRILQILPYIQKDEAYMVYMGQAWLLATVAIYHPQAVYNFLKTDISKALKNKTIAKIKESYRIDSATKNMFVALRNVI